MLMVHVATRHEQPWICYPARSEPWPSRLWVATRYRVIGIRGPPPDADIDAFDDKDSSNKIWDKFLHLLLAVPGAASGQPRFDIWRHQPSYHRDCAMSLGNCGVEVGQMKPYLLLSAVITFAVASPTATAQSYYDLLHCIHDSEPIRVIAACTRYISGTDVPEQDKLAAYYSRGLAWRESGNETRATQHFAVWQRLFDDSQINSDPNLRGGPGYLRR